MSAAHASVKRYLIIWCWLAGLMLLGVILSELSILPLPHTGVMAVVAGLSTVKAGLVALYYMHLKTDQRLLALGVVFSSVFIKL